MEIGGDFPGGNIIVRGIDGHCVHLAPDTRDTVGHWFYWCFDARLPEPGDYEFRFSASAVGPRGPAVSLDGGRHWEWGGRGFADDESGIEGFRHRHDGPGAALVRFAMCFPYLQAEWEAFLRRHGLTGRELTRSRGGRPVELLDCGTAGRTTFLFTCRHHACEASANFTLEGVIEAALADLAGGRDDFRLLAVPFVDKDGVENGDQGKSRAPHDHGRDYGDAPIYPETRALMELVEAEKPAVVIDLHAPGLRCENNETFFIVGAADPAVWRDQRHFAELLERATNERGSTPPYRAADNIPYGTDWNTAANYVGGKTLPQWCHGLPARPLALSFEVPYANSGELTMTPALWREFGAALWTVARECR